MLTHDPKYRRQRSGGCDRAFVEIEGRRHYLGRYGSDESRAEYHRLLAEWRADPGRFKAAKAGPADRVTVGQVIEAFWSHVEQFYRDADGNVTSEVDNFRQALRPVRKLYEQELAINFGPLALQAVRGCMIDAGWTRKNINKQVDRVKHAFRWATAQEMIPPSVHQALATVEGLRYGRCGARESQPVRPVAENLIESVKPLVSDEVRAMIELQLLTGCRPQDVVRMDAPSIDRSGLVWLYQPTKHKTAHRGHIHTVFIGPRAQLTLARFLNAKPLGGFLFDPRSAESRRLALMHEERVTPLNSGNRPGTNRKTGGKERKPGDRYMVGSYRRAIRRACDQAWPAMQTSRLRRRTACFNVKQMA